MKTEKIKKKIDDMLEELGMSGSVCVARAVLLELHEFIDSLENENTLTQGEISDGYHTFNELYYYRMLYNAAFFNSLPKSWVHKSKKHHDGEDCFGGGWFIVMANLPTGQISNHYEIKDWDLFHIPEKETADKWDGHTPQEAAERLHKYLLEKQNPSFKQISDSIIWDSGLRTGIELGKKQKEQKPIPSREMILGIWELGNFWKENPEARDGLTQLQYIQKYWNEKCDYQKEQKPVEKENTLTDFEEVLNIFLFDFANSPIEDCEPKEYIKKHSAEILKAAYKELNAELQQDIFEAKQDGIREGYEVAKAEQKLAEWSEEDEKKRNLLIDILKVNHPNGYFKVNPVNTLNMEAIHVEELIDWIKSLCPQPHWKPNKEQILALRTAVIDFPEDKELLSLYNDLRRNYENFII